MIEVHPFKPFIPKGAKYLLLGSFPGRLSTRFGDWYYDTKRGQFWIILRRIYGLELKNRTKKIELFSKLQLAVTDLIYKCRRKNSDNSDLNLTDIVYNTKAVKIILDQNEIIKIYFSSRFVENKFKMLFKDFKIKYPDIELVTLPSSSPRYAKLSVEQKIKIFKRLMPKLVRTNIS